MIPELFIKGGPLMYLILLSSIVSTAVFFERLYHFKRASVKLPVFLTSLKELIVKKQYLESIRFCADSKGPVPSVLKGGLVKHDDGRDRVKEGMQDNMVNEVARLEKNIPIIATISHITPLLGLLGTVLGMIKAFIVIQAKGGMVNPADLAGGISEALITTAAGLVVAIPSYMAYSYLVSRVHNFAFDMEKSATEIADLLEKAKKKHSI